MGSGKPRGRLNGIEIKPEVLRQARMRAGLSLAQVAGDGLTRQAVHLIETGKVRPSMNSLRIITTRLAVPMQAALVSSGAPPKPNGAAEELEALIRQRHYAEVVDRGQEILQSSGSQPSIAYVNYHLGHALCLLGRPTDALEQLRTARQMFEAEGNWLLVAQSMELQALALDLAEDSVALIVAEQALETYRAHESGHAEIESRLLERIGTILLGRGDAVGARAYYEQALEAAGNVRDLGRLARIYHGLSFCYLRSGDHSRAIDLVHKAETLYEAEQRISGAPPNLDLPRVENDLGMLLMAQGDLQRAEQRFLSALQRLSKLGAERLKSHLLLSLGELRYRQNRYHEGLVVVEEAVALARRLNETRALATGYKQLGELHAAQGDYDLAVGDFQRSLAILQDAGLEERRAECVRTYERVLGRRREADAATGA